MQFLHLGRPKSAAKMPSVGALHVAMRPFLARARSRNYNFGRFSHERKKSANFGMNGRQENATAANRIAKRPILRGPGGQLSLQSVHF